MRLLVMLACCLLLNGTVASQVVTTQTAAASASATQYVEIDGNKIGYRLLDRPLMASASTLAQADQLDQSAVQSIHRVRRFAHPGPGWFDQRSGSDFQPFRINDLEMVAQICFRWNPLTSWMRQIEGFQRAV
jgi:hypothetical protein